MATHFFFLLRIRCEPIVQRGLFERASEPALVIKNTIFSVPEAVVRGRTVWTIGGPREIDDGGVVFQLGRIQPVNNPQFDESSHSFFEATGERAPFTYAVFDEHYQSCAVIRKAGVSGSAIETARRLQTLLNVSQVPAESGFSIIVDALSDPEEFLEQLRSSGRITKFSFTAQFENPFDVESLIHRPAERFNEVAGGEKTKVEVEGKDLNVDLLEELTRSVVSVGDDAAATIKPIDGKKSKRIYLRGTPIIEEFDDETAIGPFSAMLIALRGAYERLRNSSA